MEHLYVYGVKIQSYDLSKLDSWGNSQPVGTERFYRCRIEQKSEVVSNQHGQEVKSGTSIYFNGKVPLDFTDKLTWKNEQGKSITESPLHIHFIKDVSGNVRQTVVNLP